jgi:hypothetical protein
MYGRKGEEVTEGWRRLRKEKHHDLYRSPNIIRVMRLAGNVRGMGAYRPAQIYKELNSKI